MSTSIRAGLRTGFLFGIILIFIALIGFTITASDLIGKIIGLETPSGQMPSTGLFIIFMSLMGLWMGMTAYKPENCPSWKDTLVAGMVTGFIAGIPTALFAIGFGSLRADKIDVRYYLSEVSPESIDLFIYNLTPFVGATIHLVLLTLSGTAGSALARGLRKANLNQNTHTLFLHIKNTVTRKPLYKTTFQSRYSRYGIYALLVLLLFILPRIMGSYWNYTIGTVGIYIVLGLGLNIIVGLSGQLVLGYVSFFAIGAYSFALLTAPEPHHIVLNFWLALFIGVTLATLSGILLGLPLLRLRGDYLAIVTLGFGEITRIMIRSDFLTKLTAGPRGVRNIAAPSLFGITFASDIDFVYLILMAVMLILFITNRLQNSRTGRAWLAIREDETVAQATGVNRFTYKLLALAIGAGIAGLAGALFASRNQFTGPEDHTMMVSINVLCLVIVGGMNSLPGIILGAFALKGLPEILRELDDYRMLVFGALLIIMMIIRPEGLMPSSRPRLEKFKIDGTKEIREES